MERGFEEVEFFFCFFADLSLFMPLSISATSAPQLQTPSSESKATTTLALGRVIQMERKEKEKLLEERRSKERENAPIPSARDDDEEQVESSGDDEEKTSSSRRRERERERLLCLFFFFFSPIAPPLPCPLCSHLSFLNHPNPLRTAQAAKASRLSGKASSEAATFEQMQGGRHAPPTRKFPVGTSLSLLPCISLKAQVFLCKKCGTIAAFANSFLPLVCHLWELRRDKEKKRKGSRGKKTTSKKKSQYGRPCEGVWVMTFFLTVFFLFLECFFFLHPASLFDKSTKIPSDRRWPTLFAVIPFFLSKIGVAGRFHFSLSGKMEAFVGLRAQ